MVLFSWGFYDAVVKIWSASHTKKIQSCGKRTVPDYIHLSTKCCVGEIGNIFLFRWHINKDLKLPVDHQTKLSHWHIYTAYIKALLFHGTEVQSSAHTGITHLRVRDLMFCACLFVQLINWKLEVCSYGRVTLESCWMIFQCITWYI